MMDVSTKHLVCGVAKELASKNAMFSAWDVTRIARSRGAKQAFHENVRAEVRDLFANGDLNDASGDPYLRHPVTLQNSAITTVVYHPNHLDHNNYDANALDPKNASASSSCCVAGSGCAVQTQPAPSTSATAVADDDDDDDDDNDNDGSDVGVGSRISLQTQGDGFIRIPAAYMRAIGINPGCGVDISNGYGEIYLSAGTDQKTDARNNLRIYNRTLSNASINKKLVMVEVTSKNRITIK